MTETVMMAASMAHCKMHVQIYVIAPVYTATLTYPVK